MSVGVVGTTTWCLHEPVSEAMQVRWQTVDGTAYESTIPVRSQLTLPNDQLMTIIFVFVPDGVDGYVYDPYPHRRLFLQQRGTVVKK